MNHIVNKILESAKKAEELKANFYRLTFGYNKLTEKEWIRMELWAEPAGDSKATLETLKWGKPEITQEQWEEIKAELEHWTLPGQKRPFPDFDHTAEEWKPILEQGVKAVRAKYRSAKIFAISIGQITSIKFTTTAGDKVLLFNGYTWI